ncbi:hypothetical protein ANCCAN_23703 [Ancylostoma caninum]|uniref:Uncharacterized protein n=1 Tax=Ancylostoma caninum TaxID=29170 RepID=A0A368FHQ3_ANCCA|nr:hypothetical protein ANCCAN_23703 [Ancylostoma caninum]
MALHVGLVFAVLCLLHNAYSAKLKDGDVPECEELGAEALRMEQRDTLVARLNEAMKNVEFTVSYE